MKTFYLVKDDEGTRFVSSSVLCNLIPCIVLGILQVPDDHVFNLSELKTFNEVIRKFEADE